MEQVELVQTAATYFKALETFIISTTPCVYNGWKDGSHMCQNHEHSLRVSLYLRSFPKLPKAPTKMSGIYFRAYGATVGNLRENFRVPIADHTLPSNYALAFPPNLHHWYEREKSCDSFMISMVRVYLQIHYYFGEEARWAGHQPIAS